MLNGRVRHRQGAQPKPTFEVDSEHIYPTRKYYYSGQRDYDDQDRRYEENYSDLGLFMTGMSWIYGFLKGVVSTPIQAVWKVLSYIGSLLYVITYPILFPIYAIKNVLLFPLKLIYNILLLPLKLVKNVALFLWNFILAPATGLATLWSGFTALPGSLWGLISSPIESFNRFWAFFSSLPGKILSPIASEIQGEKNYAHIDDVVKNGKTKHYSRIEGIDYVVPPYEYVGSFGVFTKLWYYLKWTFNTCLWGLTLGHFDFTPSYASPYPKIYRRFVKRIEVDELERPVEMPMERQRIDWQRGPMRRRLPSWNLGHIKNLEHLWWLPLLGLLLLLPTFYVGKSIHTDYKNETESGHVHNPIEYLESKIPSNIHIVPESVQNTSVYRGLKSLFQPFYDIISGIFNIAYLTIRLLGLTLANLMAKIGLGLWRLIETPAMFLYNIGRSTLSPVYNLINWGLNSVYDLGKYGLNSIYNMAYWAINSAYDLGHGILDYAINTLRSIFNFAYDFVANIFRSFYSGFVSKINKTSEAQPEKEAQEIPKQETILDLPDLNPVSLDDEQEKVRKESKMHTLPYQEDFSDLSTFVQTSPLTEKLRQVIDNALQKERVELENRIQSTIDDYVENVKQDVNSQADVLRNNYHLTLERLQQEKTIRYNQLLEQQVAKFTQTLKKDIDRLQVEPTLQKDIHLEEVPLHAYKMTEPEVRIHQHFSKLSDKELAALESDLVQKMESIAASITRKMNEQHSKFLSELRDLKRMQQRQAVGA